jgi:hypothetical protein
MNPALRVAFGVLALQLIVGEHAVAQQNEDIESPRWTYEIRAGYYEPDLDGFAMFYGDDAEKYYGLAGSYRFKDWLEFGGEYSQLRAKGVGFLTSSQVLGGSVTYRLSPVQIYSNFIFQRRPMQRVVPYLGVGLTMAVYEQNVGGQGSTDGRTDLGYSAKLGVRFLVGSRGPRPASTAGGSPYLRSYVFLEVQQLSIEADNTELGGEAYVIGFRMEFDSSGTRR